MNTIDVIAEHLTALTQIDELYPVLWGGDSAGTALIPSSAAETGDDPPPLDLAV